MEEGSTAKIRKFWLINDDRELFAVQSVKYLGGMDNFAKNREETEDA